MDTDTNTTSSTELTPTDVDSTELTLTDVDSKELTMKKAIALGFREEEFNPTKIFDGGEGTVKCDVEHCIKTIIDIDSYYDEVTALYAVQSYPCFPTLQGHMRNENPKDKIPKYFIITTYGGESLHDLTPDNETRNRILGLIVSQLIPCVDKYYEIMGRSHYDIKPHNILYNERDSTLQLIDLGGSATTDFYSINNDEVGIFTGEINTDYISIVITYLETYLRVGERGLWKRVLGLQSHLHWQMDLNPELYGDNDWHIERFSHYVKSNRIVLFICELFFPRNPIYYSVIYGDNFITIIEIIHTYLSRDNLLEEFPSLLLTLNNIRDDMTKLVQLTYDTYIVNYTYPGTKHRIASRGNPTIASTRGIQTGEEKKRRDGVDCTLVAAHVSPPGQQNPMGFATALPKIRSIPSPPLQYV